MDDDDVDLDNAPHCVGNHSWQVNKWYAGPGILYTCTRCPAAMSVAEDEEVEPRAR